MSQRPIAAVPRGVLALLALGLAAQIALKASARASGDRRRLAARAEHRSAQARELRGSCGARQGTDALPAGVRLSIRQQGPLSRPRLWPARSLAREDSGTGPRAANTPLLAASRLYAEVPVEASSAACSSSSIGQFLLDPDRRWPWLAHGDRHRQAQAPRSALALRYAQAIQRYAVADNVPLWAKQMEVFILEDMNELETARLIIGGTSKAGTIKDPAELRFLDERLKQLEARTARRTRGKNQWKVSDSRRKCPLFNKKGRSNPP